jgi:iron(III) transport system substrate-binding protein
MRVFNTRTRTITAVAFLVLGLVISACSGGASTTPAASSAAAATASAAASQNSDAAALADLYAKAKTEGSVLFYCAEAQSECDVIGNGFNAKYPGVTAQSIRLVSATAVTRFIAEKAAKAATADVLLISDFAFLNTSNQQGLTMPWSNAGIPGYASFPKAWVAPVYDVPYELNVLGIAYNTKLLTDAQAPKQWADLLKPEFKGKLNAPSPVVSSAVALLFGTMDQHAGVDDFLGKLKAQKVNFVASGMTGASASLAAGEYSVQAVANPAPIGDLIAQGASVKMVYPKDAVGLPEAFVLNAQPAHPNAQKLFASFLISKEGNEAIVKSTPTVATAYKQPDGITVAAPDFKFFDPANAKLVLGRLGF